MTVDELCAEAKREHPELAIDATIIAAALERLAITADDVRQAGDLVLAQTAALGNAIAIKLLEREHAVTIMRVCRRFAGSGHDAEDLRQILRDKLWVASPPALASYNGQGSLAAWLRILATRTFIDLGRRKDRAREELAPAALDHALAPADLSLDLIKAEYRDAVARALVHATSTLERGDRHLLRQHLVEGLSIDRLAAVLGIHRATAARRIAAARERLAGATREFIVEELGLGASELAELVDLVTSKLDVSLRTLLQSRPV